MNPPTRFALMRANRPKLALARKLAEQLEIQHIPGMDVTVLLDAHDGMGLLKPWWRRSSMPVSAGTKITPETLKIED
jgi:hypothetical protein